MTKPNKEVCHAMWFAVIGVAVLVIAGLILRRVINIVESFERDRAAASDHERRLRDLEQFRRHMDVSGEHLIADLEAPPNVQPRVVSYDREDSTT